VSRARTLFLTIIPSAIAGGFLFASAFGHAETGRDGTLGYWPAASDAATSRVLVAQADPRPHPRTPMPPMPPAPPTAGIPPTPPTPPTPPRRHSGRSNHSGMTFSIHDGKLEIDGIAELVQESLEKALETVDNLPDVPPDVRDRLKGRIKGVREKIKARLGKLKSMDLDKLGPEMERMGDDIEREMSGLDQDLAQLGDKVGKGIALKFGKDFAKSFGPQPGNGKDSDDADDDDDDDDDDSGAIAVVGPGVDNDPVVASDMGPAIAAIKGISLDSDQRVRLAKLRNEAEVKVRDAQRELEVMSNRLHDTLRNASASEDDIAHQIESISQVEATIRKARILTWVKARSVLRKDQRKRVEDAVKRGH
jgi:hypothetical protein